MMTLNKIKSLKKRLKGKPHGFTIIEVLIALAIFAIGILGVAAMQISSTNGNTSARKYTEASEFNQGQIESLMAISFTNVISGNTVTADGYTVQWTVGPGTDIDGDGDNDMKIVQVIVNDPAGKLRTSYMFTKFADI